MAAIELTIAERKQHRADAHHLDPVVLIGSDGLTPAVRREVDAALNAHGLIKVRVFGDDRAERERIWLADDNTLKDEITLIDAKAYTRPWTVTKTYHRAKPGAELIEYVCLENQRNPVNDKGEIGVILAPNKP